ncbi:unnamed protein product, partial [Effrenium voratum]
PAPGPGGARRGPAGRDGGGRGGGGGTCVTAEDAPLPVLERPRVHCSLLAISAAARRSAGHGRVRGVEPPLPESPWGGLPAGARHRLCGGGLERGCAAGSA